MDEKAFLSGGGVSVDTLTTEKELFRRSGLSGAAGILLKSSLSLLFTNSCLTTTIKDYATEDLPTKETQTRPRTRVY